jgi:pyruvate ferredoxin oxidoreductase beta subunit
VAVLIAGLPEEEYFSAGHRACAGCGEALALRTITKAAGKDTIVVSATGCMEVVSTPYPETAWKLPWVHGAFENAAAIASGVESALEKQGRKSKTNVLILAGDGGTFDIGFHALSGAIERGHDFCYVCTDNSAYMNTGIQRSSATPRFAATTTSPAGKKIHGKMEWKKPMPFIVAAHKPAYVATASIANLADLFNKVKKGLEIKGPAYIQVYTPCPVGWKFDSSDTIRVAKMAMETRITPVFEILNGQLKINFDIKKPKPVEEYLKMEGRFKHLTPEQIKIIQLHVEAEWNRLKHWEKCKAKF